VYAKVNGELLNTLIIQHYHKIEFNATSEEGVIQVMVGKMYHRPTIEYTGTASLSGTNYSLLFSII